MFIEIQRSILVSILIITDTKVIQVLQQLLKIYKSLINSTKNLFQSSNLYCYYY